MAKGLPRSGGRGTAQAQEIIKTVIRVKSATISITGASGVGWGTVVATDFPEGNVMLLGCLSYMTFTGPTSANLSDTWQGDYAVGTTPASDGTITGGDVDLIPSTALAAATAEVSPRTRAVDATGGKAGVVFDNTDGSLEINLNLLIDDADISADLDVTADGEIYLSYIMLGDD